MDMSDKDDHFCPNCRFMIDDGIITTEEPSEKSNSCEHLIVETNEYFGQEDDGQFYRFTLKRDNGHPYIDDMMEDINRAIIADGLDPETGFWANDPEQEIINRMIREDAEEEEKQMSRRNRKKNKRGRVNKWADDVMNFVRPKAPKEPIFTPEEKAFIVEHERHGVGAK